MKQGQIRVERGPAYKIYRGSHRINRATKRSSICERKQKSSMPSHSVGLIKLAPNENEPNKSIEKRAAGRAAERRARSEDGKEGRLRSPN